MQCLLCKILMQSEQKCNVPSKATLCPGDYNTETHKVPG